MATINKSTKLFEELTDQEAQDLQVWVEGVMFRGTFPVNHPDLIEQWLTIFGFRLNENTLLVISTVLPQHVLMSLLSRRDQEFGEVCKELHVAPFFGHTGVMGAIKSLVEAVDLGLGATQSLTKALDLAVKGPKG
jgi:hypothetical protein